MDHGFSLESNIESRINDHQLKQDLSAQEVMINIINKLELKNREDKKKVREMVLNSKYPFFEVNSDSSFHRTPYDYEPIVAHVINMQRPKDKILKAIRAALKIRPDIKEYILMFKHIIETLELKYYQDKLIAYNSIMKEVDTGTLMDTSYGGQDIPLIKELLDGPLREIKYKDFMKQLFNWIELTNRRQRAYFTESNKLIRVYKCLKVVLYRIKSNYKFYNEVLLHFLIYKICEYFDVPIEPLENRFDKKIIKQVISNFKSRYEKICLDP